MPNFIKIKIRRGTSSDWATSNPVLALGEIAADIDKHGLKVGNGTSRWNELPFCSPDIVNNLVTGGTNVALSAEQGKILKGLVDDKASKTELTTLETNLTTIINNKAVEVKDDLVTSSSEKALSARQGVVLKGMIDTKADVTEITRLETKIGEIIVEGGGVEVEDSLESTSTIKALSANKGRELNEKIKGMSIFGIGYTVDTYNSQSKPTQITFDDGVTATLNWSGTKLQSISASTGEYISITYDPLGRVKGRTVGRVG